jgi:hypothetical protein
MNETDEANVWLRIFDEEAALLLDEDQDDFSKHLLSSSYFIHIKICHFTRISIAAGRNCTEKFSEAKYDRFPSRCRDLDGDLIIKAPSDAHDSHHLDHGKYIMSFASILC